MGAKKKKSKTLSKDIEGQVHEQLQSALSGDFFQSIFHMREQQMQRVEQLQQQTKEWSNFSFWDVPNSSFGQIDAMDIHGANSDAKSKSSQTEDDETEQVATELENQIQVFVRHVLAKSHLDS